MDINIIVPTPSEDNHLEQDATQTGSFTPVISGAATFCLSSSLDKYRKRKCTRLFH